jgi:hypothetical protein
MSTACSGLVRRVFFVFVFFATELFRYRGSLASRLIIFETGQCATVQRVEDLVHALHTPEYATLRISLLLLFDLLFSTIAEWTRVSHLHILRD